MCGASLPNRIDSISFPRLEDVVLLGGQIRLSSFIGICY